MNDDLNKMLFPYYNKRLESIIKDDTVNLAYYASLQNIHNILSNQIIWLRNVSCMNDFYEIRQGAKLIKKYFLDNECRKLKQLIEILNKIDVHNKINWQDYMLKILTDTEAELWYRTYITSLTVHDKQDDNDGRLSMWRAYGRSYCGALILDKDKIFNLPSSLWGINLSPVAYFTDEEFYKEAEKIILNLENNIESLQNMDSQLICGILRNAIIFAICSIKHPGFKEEKEWRIIYIEDVHSNERLKRDYECIGGIPQYVYKLNLSDKLPLLLDHVIIGPIEYPTAPYTVIKDDLKKMMGTPYPDAYIKKSNITIRPNCL